MTDFKYVLAKVPTPELLAQTAEEAIELAHAALKLRRTLSSSNPTPVTKGEAEDKFEEEIADLLLCLALLGRDHRKPRCRDMMRAKLQRWAGRLRAREEDPDGQ